MTTVREIREKMMGLVAGNEEFVYERKYGDDGDDAGAGGCWYVWYDKPSCLIGQLFVELGVPLEELHKHEGRAASEIAPILLSLDDSDANAGRVFQALGKAQEMQDQRYTWGEAYAAFDTYLKGYDL